MALFSTSPSRIARYFFHQCERQFRYFATPKARRAAEHVPAPPWDASPVTSAILETGYAWEARVVSKVLAGRVEVAAGAGPVWERQHDVPATVKLLATTGPGRFIYQPTLQTPASLYRLFGIDPKLVEFGESRPDLIEVRQVDKRRRLVVHDLKASEQLKLTHRIQVSLYALQLDANLREAGIDADAELAEGGVWLADQTTSSSFELAMTRPHLEQFLRQDMTRILSIPAADAQHHLTFRCEWCEYFPHCMEEAKRTQNISLLPYLSLSAKRFLSDEHVHTLPDLSALLKRKDADSILGRCASLEGRRPRLVEQVKALIRDEVRAHGGRSIALPIGENVRVVLTLQSEPVNGEPYLFGMLVRARKEVMAELPAGCDQPQVFIAGARDDLPDTKETFIRKLHEVLAAVDHYNSKHPEWKDQLSLQTFAYDSFEQELLQKVLFEGMAMEDVADQALSLLLHFMDAGLILAEEHSKAEVPFPLVVLTDAIRSLLALPVPVAFRLQEALAALNRGKPKAFEYRHFDYYHFPLSNRLRSDAVLAAWNGDAKKLDGLAKEVRHRLWATSAVIDALRTTEGLALFAWPAKFRFPAPWQIEEPTLSRLAFLEQFESFIQCHGVRHGRAAHPEERLLLGQAVLIEAVGPARAKVLDGSIELLGDDFGKPWLVAECSAEGEREALRFNDYGHRASLDWKLPEMQRVGVAATSVVSAKQVELEVHARGLGGGGLHRGRKYHLLPRYSDFTTDRTIAWLSGIEQNEKFLALLSDPAAFLERQPLATDVRQVATRLLQERGLTSSQASAFARLASHRGAVVWGPPGTGKTHFIAAAILALAEAHRQAGKPFRVLVNAFTHAAIENVLTKLIELRGKGKLALAKLDRWAGANGPPAEVMLVDSKKQGQAFLAATPCCVVGGTVFALMKAKELAFDLVVLDEASQMRCSHAAVTVGQLAKDGRLLLAGDDRQLPPVIQGEYPSPEAREPALHRSAFEALRLRGAPVDQLLENFRMNDVLTGFAAGQLYGPAYRCASGDVADRRLPWRIATKDPDGLAEYCLDPEFPLVLAVLEGVFASRANPEEAELVARLVGALRAGLRSEDGRRFPDSERGDRAFFREGVFIVSPHHVQIREIRRALDDVRDWKSPPFVDTVDKMQGQEAAAVVVSYGVSDADFALQEGRFIYDLNRLNVSITRAQSKCVVFLPRPLLDASPAVMDDEVAADGLRFMRALESHCATTGELREFAVKDGVRLRVWRTSTSSGGR